MKPQAVIFDIDGTLADCEHRRHHLEKTNVDWPAFFAKAHLDTPLWMAIEYAQMLRDKLIILLVSGRGAEFQNVTTRWLAEHNVPYTSLFMRPAGDRRPDHEVKRDLYENFIEPHYTVRLVVDDRASVVKMWRSLGLECWQVAEGDF